MAENITLPSSAGNKKVDTFIRTEGTDEVHMQAMVPVDPVTGLPVHDSSDIAVTSVTVLNGNLFSIDASTYNYISIQLTGTWSATVTFQGSNDGTNWVSLSALNATIGAWVQSSTTTGIFTIPVATKFVRVAATAFVSGPITGAAIGGCVPPIMTSNSIIVNSSANLIGDVGFATRTTTLNTSTRQKVITTASTNATSVKASAGRVYGYQFSNTTASYKYVKLYNKASAPTVGTDVPVETIAVPPNGQVSLMNVFGVFLATGIALAVTGVAADTDATATAANDVIGALIYA